VFNYERQDGMKKIAISLLCALAPIAVAQATDNGTLTGKWKVTSSIGGNEGTQDCTFTQSGKDLTGSCVGDQGTVKVAGKVDGAKISWAYTSDYNGTALTVTYTGTLGAGKITGEASVEPFGITGAFTATAVK
jgi:hypothetical protein